MLILLIFLTRVSINLFYCCEKVFSPINTWVIEKKFNEASLPEKEDFYSHLNMKEITDGDYAHAKRIYKDFQIKILG